MENSVIGTVNRYCIDGTYIGMYLHICISAAGNVLVLVMGRAVASLVSFIKVGISRVS
jgi:hypothetical protein